MSKAYEIKFAPIDALSYTYTVEAKDEDEAVREVTEVNGEIYSIKKDDGGELEAYGWELR